MSDLSRKPVRTRDLAALARLSGLAPENVRAVLAAAEPERGGAEAAIDLLRERMLTACFTESREVVRRALALRSTRAPEDAGEAAGEAGAGPSAADGSGRGTAPGGR
jgi:hypothetical protein